jgi:beta-glucanase (GH16 family)
MNFTPQVQTKASLAIVGLTVFLSACGGGSESSTASASGSGAGPSLLAEQAFVKAPTQQQGGTAIAAGTSADGSSEGPAGQDASAYTLTFNDEFNGELDRNLWKTDRTDTAASTTNYKISDGSLKIWPQRGNNGEFFDRTIDTGERFTQRYGYFEIEAKLPKGKGAWPAFWLFNQIGERRPEIDIMEAYPGGVEPWGKTGPDGIPVPVMYAPVTWTDSTSRAGYAKVETPDLSAGFHRYGVKWEPNRQTFYFDGKEVFSHEVSISDPMYIILDLWFGSASGTPDSSTPTGEGNAFEVKYVRAWQFK